MVQLAGRGGMPSLLGSMAAHFLRTPPSGDSQRPAGPSSRLAVAPAAPLGAPPRPLSQLHRPVDSRRPVEALRSVGAGRPSVGRHRKVEVCDADFRLLFVCTGNICRSPFAQILTRHLFVSRLGEQTADQFHVSSAGVRAVAGASMHTDSRRQLSSWRLDTAAADGFVARQLQPAMVASAHLVLGVSPGHRSAVVERAPEALATTFCLREFARLATFVAAGALPPDPVARAHALIDEVRLVRGLAPPAEPDGDRVPDPMGRSPDAHRHAAKLIEDAMQSILDVIAPPLRQLAAPDLQPSGETRRPSLRLRRTSA